MTCGTDLIHLPGFGERVKNPDFLNRSFTAHELSEARGSARKLAGIFCVKEAFFKASGAKIKRWADLEVYRDEAGRPRIRFSSEDLPNAPISVDCSISHDGDYVLGFVVIEFAEKG